MQLGLIAMVINDYLILSQTLFYLSLSVVLFSFGFVVIATLYYLFKITRHIEQISRNLEYASDGVRKNISFLIEKLMALPLVSILFRKHRNKKVVKSNH